MDIEKIQLWEDKENVTLTIYHLQSCDEIKGSSKRPAVIIAPGGGYEMFTERESEAVALRFAAAGYQASVLRYSIGEDALFPNAVCDIAKAMVYFHQNEERLHIDSGKVIVCGFSAGGNLAASLGVLWDHPMLLDRMQVPAEWLRPAAMILGYSQITPFIRRCREAGSEEEAAVALSFQHLTGTRNPDRQMLEKLDLLKYVSDNTPPAFLFHLCGDPVVPVENSLRFAEALAVHQIPFELFVGDDNWHGVSSFEAKDSDIGFFRAEYAEWFQRAITWLKGRVFEENKTEI